MSEAIFEPRRQSPQASTTVQSRAELRPEPAKAPPAAAAEAPHPEPGANKFAGTYGLNLRSEAVIMTDTVLRQGQVPRATSFELGTLHATPGSQAAVKQLQGRLQAQLRSDGPVPECVDSMQRMLQRLPIAAAIFLALRETVRESMHKSYDQLQRIEELDAVGKALGRTLVELSGQMKKLHEDRDALGDDPDARKHATVAVKERNYAAFPGLTPDGKEAQFVKPTVELSFALTEEEKEKRKAWTTRHPGPKIEGQKPSAENITNDGAKIEGQKPSAENITNDGAKPEGQEKSAEKIDTDASDTKVQMNFEGLSAYIKNVQLQQQNVTHMRERCEQQFTASDSLRSGNLKALVDYIKRLHESCQSLQMNARLS